MDRLCLHCGADISHKPKKNTHCSRRCAERVKYRKNNPNFNEDFFAAPGLENSYWAGFIAGDGCVYDKNAWQNQLHIALKIDDKNHLEILKTTIGAGSLHTLTKTLKTTGNTYHQIKYTLYSDKICSDLAGNFNIHPRKSLTHGPPNLKGSEALAFIAGYIDADGSYTFTGNRPVIATVGTFEFLDWMNKILGVESKITCCGNYYATSINGDKAILTRQEIHNLDLPLLKRKKNRWEELNLNLKIRRKHDN